MPFTDSLETNALKSKIEEILKTVPDFVTQGGELKLNIIKNAAENGDEKLLAPLLKNAATKKVFFKPVLDSFVFESAKFKEILEYSSGCNSYSKYLGQKIGLYFGDSAFTDRSEVVLNFPFKDCVLEGGQSKEDGLDAYFEWDEKLQDFTEKKSKRREVFYNEILAQDEIDNLFSPKAFCKAKRFERNSNEAVEPAETSHLKRNAEINRKRGLSDDTITDNLIIKGNNLLALHSLKKGFAGKIKLIYIDPPYNTGNDGFAYNDNFNHSSWLTFMKNRLEVARELLKEDGVIFVQIDNSPSDLQNSPEFGYLLVLMDMIFKRTNYLTTLTWRKKGNASNTQDGIGTITESILMYAKNINEVSINILDFKRRYDYSDENGGYNLEVPIKTNDGDYERKTMKFEIKTPEGTFLPPEGKRWTLGRETMEDIVKLKKYEIKNGIFKVKKYREDYKKGDGKLFNNLLLEQGSLKSAKTELEKLGFRRENFNSPKPESLIKQLLQISTSPSDIVLDYHLGSGTTAAVAHKMSRQYIGVEQMDYIESVAVERLKKVICGEQGGISKSVGWQGGGSFVYMELAKKNERAAKLISSCKNLCELVKIFDTLSKKYFLHYNVRVKEFRNEVVTSGKFASLPLERQKEMFIRMLDLNQLYLNVSDRHDTAAGLAQNDIAFTEDFYRLKND